MDAIRGSIWARKLVGMGLPFQTIVGRLMDDVGLTYTDAAAAAIEEAQLRNAILSGRFSAQLAVPHSLDLTTAIDVSAVDRGDISLVDASDVDVVHLHEDTSLVR